MTKSLIILRLEDDKAFEMEDLVVEEYPLTLYLQGEEWLTLLCSPMDLEAMVYGFLKSEGMIQVAADVVSMTLDRDKGHAFIVLRDENPLSRALHGRRTQTSGCGKGITFYNVLDTINLRPISDDLVVSFEDLKRMMRTLNQSSELFKATGGVHSCALCNPTTIVDIKEDIGRHNALDKLIGQALLEGRDITESILMTSGRISSEILLKSARVGIPIIASHSAPTNLAVAEAQKLGITLIGFLRGNRCNVYCGESRIK